MTLGKALQRALDIEALTRIEEEDNEPEILAIQSKEDSQIVNSIIVLVQNLLTNQSNSRDNQKFSSQGARPKKFLRGSEQSSRETGDRNRIFIAIPEAALIIVGMFMTVELNRQQQEATTEAEIGHTRIVLSSQKPR